MVSPLNTGGGQCFPGCNLGLQDCPNAGQKCAYAGTAPTITRQCVMAGTVGEDGACTQNADMGDNCAAGFVCYMSKCTKYCILGDQASCSTGRSCSRRQA